MVWVLASACLLCFTSCLNEAADPNSGEGQLPSNVATLAEQLAAMKSSVTDIEFVQAILSDCAELQSTAAQFEACATSVNEHIANVESGLSGVTAVMTTLKLQGKIAQVVGALKAHVSLHSNAGALNTGINALDMSVAQWLGKDFSYYYGVAAQKARLESVLAVAQSQSLSADAIASDVQAGLRVGDAAGLESLVETVGKNLSTLSALTQKMSTLTSEVEQGYSSAIKSEASSTKATLKALNTKAAAAVSDSETSLADLSSRISACEAALANLDERLEKVEADVAELLGMIQSVTFMSEYAEDYAYAYYDMDLTQRVSNDELPYNGKAQRTATGTMDLTYMVRPASAAKALNANLDAIKVIGYYAKAAISTKAPLASDYIDFEVTKVATVNESRGLVTVTVKPNLREAFYYFEIGAKCALSITNDMTDVMSNFVELYPKENSNRVYVYSVTPSRDYIVIKKGESTSLTADVYPGDVTTPGCHFSSSNPNVVTYDQSTGQIIAKEVGEATITITSKGTDEWGLPVIATCGVKVEEAITLAGPPYVEVGYTADMFLSYPENAIIESKVWKSSDDSKLTVDENGKVTAVAHTYNDVTKQYNDVTVSCTVNGVTTVSWPMFVAATQPKSIDTPTLSNGQTEVSIKVDESFSLASTISPTNVPAGAYKIRYQSDHDRFINYDTGVINEYKNTLNPTSAYVYITVDNHDQEKYMVVGALKKTVIVKVLPYYVSTITFEPVEMQLGQSVTLSPRFTSDVDGKAPTNTKVTWQSSNEAVATVDANGVVTSKSSGSVTITATATDGTNVSGTCSVTITQPWKSFEPGDYVVRTSNGDIEFASDVNAARAKGTIVGVVVAKTNPRATDSMLPSTCTHGIAIALGESAEVAWWSGAPSSSPYKVYEWALQNGYQSTMGVDWSSSKGTHLTGTYDLFVGYNNTTALHAFVAAKGVTSEMLTAVLNYRKTNGGGPTLPNDASQYYLPSYAEMNAIAAVSNNSFYLSNKIKDAGGTAFTNAYYWVASDSGNSSSNALKVNPLTGAWNGGDMKTNKFRVRFVFAF